MNNNDSSSSRPPRRLRYRGTHPRQFHEKYKEHDPARFSTEVDHIRQAGKTPAGSHRPILVAEVMRTLALKPGETVVDATLGYGGHALELARAVLPGGRLIATDADPIELPKAEARLLAAGLPKEAIVVRRMNFAGIPKLLAELAIEGVDAVLADLGLSSMQIDNPDRGFSFKHGGPLDMRLNPERGRPAADWLRTISAADLGAALRDNADEPRADWLAEGILAIHRRTPIRTTAALAQAARDVHLSSSDGARGEGLELSIRRVFQAVRIEVNDEFSALESFLRVLPGILRPGARVAILTFHSGEDRRVKNAFRDGRSTGIYSSIADEVGRPSADEIRSNPRATPAKLRWAVRAAPVATV